MDELSPSGSRQTAEPVVPEEPAAADGTEPAPDESVGLQAGDLHGVSFVSGVVPGDRSARMGDNLRRWRPGESAGTRHIAQSKRTLGELAGK